MATAAIMMASMAAVSAVTTIAVAAQQRSDADDNAMRQQQYADEAAERRVAELRRQQERANEVAAEEKSDVARASDMRIGNMIAVAADYGQTPRGLARLASAEAAVKGVDIARIEGNRVEDAWRRRYSSVSAIEENQYAQEATQSQLRANNLQFWGTTLGAGLKYGSTIAGGFAGTGPTPGTENLSAITSASHRPGSTSAGRW